METVTVQCVYGASHLKHINECLIPSLARSTSRPVKLTTINYDPSSTSRIESGKRFDIDVVDIENRSKEKTGFSENHNTLFNANAPKDHFVIINPDCIANQDCIDLLIERKATAPRVGIVEGRQWPFEHPKEYDPLSLETPWASGAFALIDAPFYRSIGGMDDTYFLYMEDVDLSWQAWLNGYSVIYEPASTVAHFSGGRFYRGDIVSPEHYLSLRNFIILMKKFFGEEGEKRAIDLVKQFHDRELAGMAIFEYETVFKTSVKPIYAGRKHKQVKVLGLNQFHRLRSV